MSNRLSILALIRIFLSNINNKNNKKIILNEILGKLMVFENKGI